MLSFDEAAMIYDLISMVPQTLATGAELFLIPAVLGAATAGIGFIQQQKQASAAKRAQDSVRKGAEIQSSQLDAAAREQRLLRERQAAQARGRLSVNTAAAGISEADYANLYGQVETDLQENLSIIDTNLVNQKALVQTGAQADISRLDAQRGNPFLSAILGGLQGAQTGLSIASLGQSIGAANRVADPNLTAGQQASIT